MSRYHFIEKNFNWEEGDVIPQPQASYQRLSKSKNPVRTLDFSPIFALVHNRRYVCASCHKTFYESIPGIDRYQRRSNTLINKILYVCSNKIKVLKRTAFGFRNFSRFRARILWLFRVKQQ